MQKSQIRVILPEGGRDGGQVMATGTPEEVAAKGVGHTAPYLAKEL